MLFERICLSSEHFEVYQNHSIQLSLIECQVYINLRDLETLIMPLTIYQQGPSQIPRRRQSINGDHLRRGAKQPLQAMNRTIGGHVAGLMPHEYNTTSNNQDDETPRTARAFAFGSAAALPNISRDFKKRQRKSFDPTNKKQFHKVRGYNNKEKENASNNNNNTLNSTRTPPKQQQQQQQQQQSSPTTNEEKYQTEREGKENHHGTAPTKRNNTNIDLDFNPATPTRLYVTTRTNSTPTNITVETPPHQSLEDSAEFDQAPDISPSPPMTPEDTATATTSPTITQAHQWNARQEQTDRERRLNDLGIEFEGKYNEEDARTAQRSKTKSPHQSHQPHQHQPPVSPIRSPHPTKLNRSQRSLESEGSSKEQSPEPETARAHQFQSNRSPAAAMARLRRMKSERKNNGAVQMKPSTPLRNTATEATAHANLNLNASQPRRPGAHYTTAATEAEDAQRYYEREREHHHHHHHYHQNKHKEGKVQETAPIVASTTDNNNAVHIDPNYKGGAYDYIFSRARHGRLDEVRTALSDNGMDVNSRDIHGNTLLHIACQNGNKKLVKMVLRKHADINATNNNGNTSLHFCFMYAYYGMAEYIMSKGADDTVRNNQNQTPYDVDR